MFQFQVFIRPTEPEFGPARAVTVYASSENNAVQAVARQELGGTIYAVRPAYSTLPL